MEHWVFLCPFTGLTLFGPLLHGLDTGFDEIRARRSVYAASTYQVVEPQKLPLKGILAIESPTLPDHIRLNPTQKLTSTRRK